MNSSSSDAANGSQMNSRGKKPPAVHGPANAPTVSPFDPRRSGQFTPLQVQALELLHKDCAARLGVLLSGQSRANVDAELASVEQLSGAELLDRVPDPSYLLFLGTSYNASGLLQMDLSLAFPFLDVLLGGSGAESPEPRELTEIEHGILNPLAGAFCRALQQAWQPVLNVSLQLESPALKSGLSARLPLGDRVLLVTFQIRFQKFEGRMLAVFPAQVSAALLRKLQPQATLTLPAPSLDRAKLREKLLESTFRAELLLPRSSVSFRQLSNLQPGDVLLLEVPATSPLEVRVADQHRFMAAPVRCGNKRGAQVHQVLSIVPTEEEKRQ